MFDESVTYDLKSRDFWIKVIEMLQENWALIEESENDPSCIVYFIACGRDCGVFDQLEYDSLEHAKAELRYNGFMRCIPEEGYNDYFLDKKPQPPFYKYHHPNGPIYSSGKFWRKINLP